MAYSPDEFTPVAATDTEFEARTKAAVLDDEGITAHVHVTTPSWSGGVGLTLGKGAAALVLVRHADVERARDLLTQRIADSVDLDWDEVDVGEPMADMTGSTGFSMPLLAKVGFTVAVLLLVSMALGLLAIFR